MRSLFALVVLAGSISVLPAGANEQKGFLIQTTFEYQAKNRISKSDSTFILDAKNRAWTALTEPNDGVALLGRVTSSDSKSLQMEYLVVDTNQKNAVISTPAIHTLLGEAAKIEVGQSNGDTIRVSLIAESTAYTSEN